MIYLILPAYNEEASLKPLLTRVKQAMDVGSTGYRVIVVNDGSTDRTASIAQELSTLMPVTVIDHKMNRGLGAGLETGLNQATAMAKDQDVLVTMDADNTHSPDLIPAMVAKLREGCDVVIGSRYADGGREVGLSLRRKILSRGSSFLLRTFFPISGVRDYTCGYRAYRASTIKQAFSEYGIRLIEERGFTCHVELLLKLRTLGISACEAPLVLRYDLKGGASKMRVARTIARYLLLIARNLFLPGSRLCRNVPVSRSGALVKHPLSL